MTERVHVRREVATQGVSQGLPAQMSEEMPRSAHGGCLSERRKGIACAHVGKILLIVEFFQIPLGETDI